MLIWRVTSDEAWTNLGDIDFDQMLETVGKFNEELINAGVLIAAEGLAPAEEGVVVDSPPNRRSSPTARTGRPRSCSTAST
ncbi:hypothetical protein SAMN05421507_11210 [Lentzea jiangxiensis]|uniref:Uncharacterized protein n=1 Tax=Lentzea jiangxiensis TaxID=641025 RepID=A0A1H0UH71_9PSEU|nr:hypothetical protein SAMN05421507_11210 [Lentzea jiangxiensis]